MTGLRLSSAELRAHGGNATLIIPHHWEPDEPVCDLRIWFLCVLCTYHEEYEKLEKFNPTAEKRNSLSRFDTVPAYDRRTDGRTDLLYS